MTWKEQAGFTFTLALVVMSSFSLGVLLDRFVLLDNTAMVEEVYGRSHDMPARISGASDSMGLVFDPGDKVERDPVLPGDKLYPGYVYTYNTPGNGSVIHRLVEIINITELHEKGYEEVLVFKGDNNRVGELVNRTQVDGFVWARYIT